MSSFSSTFENVSIPFNVDGIEIRLKVVTSSAGMAQLSFTTPSGNPRLIPKDVVVTTAFLPVNYTIPPRLVNVYVIDNTQFGYKVMHRNNIILMRGQFTPSPKRLI